MSLNVSDFSLSFVWKFQTLRIKSPPFPHHPPSKLWGPVKPPLFENLVGGSTSPAAERGGGAHYACFPICRLCCSEISMKQHWYIQLFFCDVKYYPMKSLFSVCLSVPLSIWQTPIFEESLFLLIFVQRRHKYMISKVLLFDFPEDILKWKFL